jgi:hypothetical protein
VAWGSGPAEGEVGRAKQISCFARWAYNTQARAEELCWAKGGRRDKYRALTGRERKHWCRPQEYAQKKKKKRKKENGRA